MKRAGAISIRQPGVDRAVDRRFRPKSFADLGWILSASLRFGFVRQKLPLHIVTGADASHEKSLLRLLESIEQFEPSARLTVWDLGLSRDVKANISQKASIDFRTFNFGDYPDYFDIRVEAGQYAWKPTIINEMNSGEPELLVWLDAGNLVLGELTWLRKIVGKLGFFSPFSSGDLKTWAHPITLQRLNFAEDPSLFRNLTGGLVAYRTDHAKGTELIRRWAEVALDRESLAPEGSSRLNHRQDQAVLSVLAIQRGFRGRQAFRKLERPLNIVTHKDVD